MSLCHYCLFRHAVSFSQVFGVVHFHSVENMETLLLCSVMSQNVLVLIVVDQ